MTRFRTLHTQSGDVTPAQQAAVLDAIKKGYWHQDIKQMIIKLLHAKRWDDLRVYRTLQSLRRKGLICFHRGQRGGWKPVDPWA